MMTNAVLSLIAGIACGFLIGLIVGMRRDAPSSGVASRCAGIADSLGGLGEKVVAVEIRREFRLPAPVIRCSECGEQELAGNPCFCIRQGGKG
jgi:hypothetical protein